MEQLATAISIIIMQAHSVRIFMFIQTLQIFSWKTLISITDFPGNIQMWL